MPTLDDTEAIALCNTPNPTARSVKRLLEWATDPPRADKIPFLLLLQTNNHLSRKGLAAGFHGAVAACAKGDPGPLWKTIEGDWDTYRVLHAIRSLAATGDKAQVERLLALCNQPLLRIHWSAIAEAAEQHGVTVTARHLQAQERIEAKRGPGDFHVQFEARKSTWPSQFDLQGKSAAKKVAKTAAKPKAGSASALPAFLDASKESHPFIQSHKQALSKKWSVGAMGPLFAAVDLAYYLYALERSSEAEDICAFLASSVAFAGNFNVWTPVGYGMCLRARLLRVAGKQGEATRALQPVLEHPFRRLPPEAEMRAEVESLPQKLRDAATTRAKKAACQDIARQLYKVSLYSEHAAAKAQGYTFLAPKALESAWQDGLRLLCERLGSGAR